MKFNLNHYLLVFLFFHINLTAQDKVFKKIN